MSRRVGDKRLADDTVPAVDRDVVLVAERRNCNVDLLLLAVLRRPGLGELHGPTGIGILLPRLERLVLPDLLCRLSGLDPGLLVLGVALTWRSNGRGVHNLT